MPVEKSGVDEFEFEYGDDFGEHIAKYDLLASKVLVRYNPDGDKEMNERQTERLKQLADWLHENDRKFLFELLVPAEDDQLDSVGGDTDRYDAELRPELMRRAIEHFQDAGVEVDIWKIEGVDTREDAEMLSEQTRKGEGRENVKSVLLGRGASDDKVDHWLQQAAPRRGLHRLRDRPLDLVGRAEGLPRRRPRARGRRRADRRQLPALHQGLRRGRERRQRLGLTRAAAASASSVRRAGTGPDCARDTRSRRAIPDSIAAADTAAATAGATARLKTLGTMYSGPEPILRDHGRDRARRGELHRLVDAARADVQRAAEDAREREHVVDLVRVVASGRWP